MILFQATMTVKNVEKKSFPKKDGGMFEYYEAVCVTTDKKPTTIAMRVSDEAIDTIRPGETADFNIAISSYEGKDGRVWNNFSFMGKKPVLVQAATPKQPFETALSESDEIPF